jgi:predicted outer membrane repeat protein
MVVWLLSLSFSECVKTSNGNNRVTCDSYCQDYTLSLANVLFHDLTSGNFGGAIYMQTRTIRGDFTSLTFDKCTAQLWGGAADLNCDQWEMTRTCGARCQVVEHNEGGGHFISCTTGGTGSVARGIKVSEVSAVFCRPPTSSVNTPGSWHLDAGSVITLSTTNVSDCYSYTGSGTLVGAEPTGASFLYLHYESCQGLAIFRTSCPNEVTVERSNFWNNTGTTALVGSLASNCLLSSCIFLQNSGSLAGLVGHGKVTIADVVYDGNPSTSSVTFSRSHWHMTTATWQIQLLNTHLCQALAPLRPKATPYPTVTPVDNCTHIERGEIFTATLADQLSGCISVISCIFEAAKWSMLRIPLSSTAARTAMWRSVGLCTWQLREFLCRDVVVGDVML